MMDRLIAYAARSDPSFPARIKGATSAEIAAYEEVFGAPIPALLRAYFAAMGGDNGGLSFASGGDTDMPTLLDYMRSNRKPDRYAPMFPTDVCLVGVRPQPGAYVVLHPCDVADPPVHDAEEELLGLVADSFEKLLFQTAFCRLRMEELPYAASYMEVEYQKVSLSDALALAREAGFSVEWFSDSGRACLEREDARACILRPADDRLSLAINATSDAALRTAGAVFAEPLGLRRPGRFAGEWLDDV